MKWNVLQELLPKSKLTLLSTTQANESERRSIEARKETLFRKQLTEKMAG